MHHAECERWVGHSLEFDDLLDRILEEYNGVKTYHEGKPLLTA